MSSPMRMNRLSQEDYRSTFGVEMIRQGSDHAPLFDFWPYVDAIPKADFEGYDCSAGSVQYVYRTDDSIFEHVLIDTREDRDVFMIVVLNLAVLEVFGHLLLDLRTKYELNG